MITKSKLGVFKPNSYLASILRNPQTPVYIINTPESIQEALNVPLWKKAMDEEYIGLMDNHTWDLVPRHFNMHIVDNKWIFRVKFNLDGSVQHHKARLVAKGFQHQPGIYFFKHSALLPNHPPFESSSLLLLPMIRMFNKLTSTMPF